jgi:molybdenum cofactor biosynthesis protein B
VSVEEHKQYAPSQSDVRIAVVTASDSRTAESDEGGRLVRMLAEQAGFRVTETHLLREEPTTIRQAVSALIEGGAVDAILITGGTGLSGRDSTVEAVEPLLEKSLPGFGELFRMLSFADIGPAAMLSRAFGGVARGVALFAMPGSPAGVRLAMERLIVPELPHLLGQVRRRQTHGHGHDQGTGHG